MKSFNVSLHVMFRCEVSFANVTFEGLLPFMNCCSMFFQTVLWFKVYITNFTFALLFSYLYCTKICLLKLLLHLKSLLQISHMYFFILSWTDASWNSKAVFPPKLEAFCFRIQFCSFSSRLTTPPNLCLITRALAISLEHMHKKFEINRSKIKGGCQSGRKVVTHITIK